MDGFIIVDKCAGMTSHDVVSSVRRLVGMKKVGHTGTLDPFATGVLPIALGEATKAIPFLDESVKEYRAVMRLGASTDTQDLTGAVIRQGEWRDVSPARIADTFRLFIGRGSQVPPMYSALKRNGVPLYRLARKGEDVHREPRDIEIYSLVIDRMDLPDVTFTVRCSRGVYVRTLANDIGDRLDTGAHLVELRRIASGPFRLENALSLEDVAVVTGRKSLDDHLISCHAALEHLRDLPCTEEGARRIARGIAPEAADLAALPDSPLRPMERVRCSRNGRLLAVAEATVGGWPDSAEKLHLARVFNEHCLYIEGHV